MLHAVDFGVRSLGESVTLFGKVIGRCHIQISTGVPSKGRYAFECPFMSLERL